MWRRVRHWIVERLYGKRWYYWGAASDVFLKFDAERGKPIGTSAANMLCMRLAERPDADRIEATIEGYELRGKLIGDFRVIVERIKPAT